MVAHHRPQQEIRHHQPAGGGGPGPRPRSHLRGRCGRRELQTWHAREMGPRIRGPEWHQPRSRHGAGVWIRTDRTIQRPGGVRVHRRGHGRDKARDRVPRPSAAAGRDQPRRLARCDVWRPRRGHGPLQSRDTRRQRPGSGRRNLRGRLGPDGEYYPGVRARRAHPRTHRGHPALRGPVEHLPHARRRLPRDRRQRRHRLRAVCQSARTSRVGRGRKVRNPPRPRREPGRTGRLDLRLDQPTKRARGTRDHEGGRRPGREALHRRRHALGRTVRGPPEHRHRRGPGDRTIPDAERRPPPLRNTRRGALDRTEVGPAQRRSVQSGARDGQRGCRRSARTGHRLMHIEIVDVGPRDGLQNEDKTLAPEVRAELCEKLAAAGVPRVEAASFVNPKRVPQMAGAEEVMAAIERSPDTTYAGLVLNEKGYERAIEAGVDEVRYAFPVTETFARRNQNTTVADATQLAARLVERARLDGVRVSITLSATFGDPFEGRVKPEHVLRIAASVAASGPDEIVLADTIGVGVPTQVQKLVEGVLAHGITVGCHFHDTRNTGIANAAAAVESGAKVLDASVGGTGGCPFAPRATGNIATEDLVYLLNGMGYETGIDLDALIEVAAWLSEQLEKELPGQLHKAGNFG